MCPLCLTIAGLVAAGAGAAKLPLPWESAGKTLPLPWGRAGERVDGSALPANDLVPAAGPAKEADLLPRPAPHDVR